MKSLKPCLIAVAALISLAALCLPTLSSAAPKENTQQDIAASNTASSAKSNYPTLTINGKENSDVYLQSLDIQVEVTGNIASTRYTMVFKNKTHRMLEGELTFPLPDGRSVTHYALDINGKMRDAVPVEKAMATQVFEEIEQRRVDPGLLERVEGNNFRTRIYPFPATGTRTISVGYEEELPLDNDLLQYRLPMAYTDPIETFTVKATVWKSGVQPIAPKSDEELRFDKADENYVAVFTRKNYRPTRALNFSLPAPADIPQLFMQPAQGSYYFFASVAPKTETRKKQWNNELTIIWDVSLSGSQRDLKREMEALDIIFAEKKNAVVYLYFLNNTLFKMINKNTPNGEYKVIDGKWDGLKGVLLRAVFDGGTDFSKINLSALAGNEILFFSDGISTLSDADFIKNNNANKKRPVHCLVSSAIADYSAMRLIAGKTKGKFVNLNAMSSEELKNELLNETLQFLGTEHGDAIREVYPSIATPVYGNFSTAGISEKNNAELTLLFGFGNVVEKRIKVKLDMKWADNQISVHRLWAQKKIAELDLAYEKNRAELTDLGRQFGIVTRNMSLLVLETVNDYLLYNITPPTTDPDLYAEYLRRQKSRSAQSGGSARNMLGAALNSANTVKKWWTAEVAPKILTPPMPDSQSVGSGHGGSGSSAEPPAQLPRITNKTLRLSLYGNVPTSPQSNEPTSSQDNTHLSSQGNISVLSQNNKQTSTQNNAPISSQSNKQISPHSNTPTSSQTNALVSAQNNVSTSSQSNLPTSPQSKEPPAAKNKPAENTASSQQPQPTKKSDAKNTAQKSMAFEAAEVMGYLDCPTPTYIIDIDDPNADPITLDRSFKDHIKQIGQEILGPGGPIGPIGSIKSYLSKLTGKMADDYLLYLKRRSDYASSPSFYFDFADWFYTHGDKKRALRVLTSIAELALEDAALYRMLAYRLKEYGEYPLEAFVCKKVVQWRPMEPQSYRDYALALADNGKTQAALDSLYGLLTKLYSENIKIRSHGIEEVVITEINHLIAKNANLNTSKIDTNLIIDVPVDIRVVINWNMNNTNIDLRVIDPNDEAHQHVYYYDYRSSKKSMINGRLSANNTSGYGPEQFLLKNAIKGKYRILVEYYGDRQFIGAGPTTIMAEIYTKYAGKTEQRQVICLQMSNSIENTGNRAAVTVAEIEF
jgi:tetratricopeptide (TPR) repeat protein